MAEKTYRVFWIGEGEEIIASNPKHAKQIASNIIDESELKIKKFKIVDCVDSKQAVQRKVV